MKFVLYNHRTPVLRSIAAVLISTTLASCGASTGPKRLLQFKVFPRNSFILYVSTDTDITVTSQGTSVSIGGESDMAYRFQVASIDPEGIVEFDVKIQSAKYPGLRSPLGPALTGQSFTIRMAPTGEIVGLEKTNALRKTVEGRLDPTFFKRWIENETEEEKNRRLKHYIKQIMSHLQDDALHGTFEPFFRIWPATPVSVGDTWTRESIPIHSFYLGLFSETELTVASWDATEVTLSIRGPIQTLEGDQENDLSGQTSGSIIIDPVTGFLKSAILLNTYEGTIPNNTEQKTERVHVVAREETYFELLRL